GGWVGAEGGRDGGDTSAGASCPPPWRTPPVNVPVHLPLRLGTSCAVARLATPATSAVSSIPRVTIFAISVLLRVRRRPGSGSLARLGAGPTPQASRSHLYDRRGGGCNTFLQGGGGLEGPVAAGEASGLPAGRGGVESSSE